MIGKQSKDGEQISATRSQGKGIKEPLYPCGRFYMPENDQKGECGAWKKWKQQKIRRKFSRMI
nr:MAG TPA: hypothetical protein [Caudoviricetes sp.]